MTSSTSRRHILAIVAGRAATYCRTVSSMSIVPDLSPPSASCSGGDGGAGGRSHPTMPAVGFGTFMIPPNRIADALTSAILFSGYKRIDCAPVYFNEHAIGDALVQEIYGKEAAGGEDGNKQPLERSDLFLVSKLPPPYMHPDHVERALRKTLADLRTDYLDLYLIHWPAPMKYVPFPDDGYRGWPDEAIDDSADGRNLDDLVSVHDTWMAMERLVESGLVRHIGVSNFPLALLRELLTRAQIAPLLNQVEVHPYNVQEGLVRYCRARGVGVQAYSPLGSGGYADTMDGEPELLKDPVIRGIAEKKGVTAAQLVLAWAVRRGLTVVTKSENSGRQAENFEACQPDLVDRLTEEDMEVIESLDRGHRFFRPSDWWGDSAYAVFG